MRLLQGGWSLALDFEPSALSYIVKRFFDSSLPVIVFSCCLDSAILGVSGRAFLVVSQLYFCWDFVFAIWPSWVFFRPFLLLYVGIRV